MVSLINEEYGVMLEVETTADGSTTLYRSDLNERYHSVKGALTESEHVYLNLGWSHQLKGDSTLRVFEVGFGTGLNAALTAEAARKNQQPTEYFSVELFPLPVDVTTKLHYLDDDDFSDAFRAVNSAAWNEQSDINPFFKIHKIEGDLLTLDLPGGIDVVYFDAFAPEKQPELWEEKIFQRIFDAMNPGGVLVTYCAKGCIRRMLNEIGFKTERLPGPPGGKREVLRANKI